MKTGTVKYFNDDKGYGFIIVDGDQSEVFFHITELTEAWEGEKPEKDMKVTFEVTSGDRGPKAVNVSPAGSEEEEENA